MLQANMPDNDRLDRIECLLQQLVDRSTIKSHYTVEEFAGMVKRATFTVRQWCNEGRIHAEKSIMRSGSMRSGLSLTRSMSVFSERGSCRFGAGNLVNRRSPFGLHLS